MLAGFDLLLTAVFCTADDLLRLWQMNAARMGAGDPNLVDVGTVLRLRA